MPVQVLPIKVCSGQFRNYSYLVTTGTGGEFILVDPAWEAGKIDEAIRQWGTRCMGIFITHAHPDHVDLAAACAVKYGTSVYMSRVEINAHQFQCPNLAPMEDDDWVGCGDAEVIAILTPGHTPGGMCFQIGKNLFSGDTLFAEGCGMCFGDGSSPEDLFDSLQKLKTVITPDTRIFPGHSYGMAPGQLFSDVLDANIYLQLKKKEDFVAYRMRSGQKGWGDFK